MVVRDHAKHAVHHDGRREDVWDRRSCLENENFKNSLPGERISFFVCILLFKSIFSNRKKSVFFTKLINTLTFAVFISCQRGGQGYFFKLFIS